MVNDMKEHLNVTSESGSQAKTSCFSSLRANNKLQVKDYRGGQSACPTNKN